MRIPKKPYLGRGTIQEANAKKSREQPKKRKEKKAQQPEEKKQSEN